ncbi:hypothetical protein LMG26686_01170 [Achromobacter mucicolens]|uniref:T6SS immunity protein Tdi1 domain-containing protein n=1 Tax=Achromobacter mucicolens TaxID=1389922 RepID=UPI0014677328|nr:T6SS immunity protein Tdi1 domain-containing protein [Achromobacter mucicolens]CAB3835548.1 hypothetical protein LMG26686_01170 [Achromobacter mucicolens]
MFRAFHSIFIADTPPVSEGLVRGLDEGSELSAFLNGNSGVSFNGGIYRVLPRDSISVWDGYVTAAFPSYSGYIDCFGVDWLGRIFAVDSRRDEGGMPGVVLFEPGTGDSFDVPGNIITFHNDVLLNRSEAALAESFYKMWIGNGGPAPRVDQCIGYKRPLFLGGEDELSNLEVADLDVYWNLASQLIQRVRNLPVGTPIGNISINDSN